MIPTLSNHQLKIGEPSVSPYQEDCDQATDNKKIDTSSAKQSVISMKEERYIVSPYFKQNVTKYNENYENEYNYYIEEIESGQEDQKQQEKWGEKQSFYENSQFAASAKNQYKFSKQFEEQAPASGFDEQEEYCEMQRDKDIELQQNMDEKFLENEDENSLTSTGKQVYEVRYDVYGKSIITPMTREKEQIKYPIVIGGSDQTNQNNGSPPNFEENINKQNMDPFISLKTPLKPRKVIRVGTSSSNTVHNTVNSMANSRSPLQDITPPGPVEKVQTVNQIERALLYFSTPQAPTGQKSQFSSNVKNQVTLR